MNNILVFVNIAVDEIQTIRARHENPIVTALLDSSNEPNQRLKMECYVLLYNVPKIGWPIDLACEILSVLGLSSRVVSAKWINIKWDSPLLVKMEDRRFVMEVMKLKEELKYHPKWNLITVNIVERRPIKKRAAPWYYTPRLCYRSPQGQHY